MNSRYHPVRLSLACQWLLFVLCCLFMHVVFATTPERGKSDVAERPPLRFAVPAFRPKQEMIRRWQPVANYLEQKIPSHRVVLVVMTIKELENAVRAKQVDLVLTQPGHYVALSIEQNLYSPLATLVETDHGQALTTFGGVIFTKADNKQIHSFADLKGKRVAASVKASLGGYQMQAYELLSAGIPTDAYRVYEVGQQQDLVIAAVMSGKADAGFVRTGLLEQMARSGKIKLSDVKVLKAASVPDYPLLLSTHLYPQWALAAMPWVEPSVARQVASAVLSLPHNSEVAEAARISGFTIPGDYRSVEHLMRVLRIPPFNERVPLQVIWEDHRALAITTMGILSLTALWSITLLMRARWRRKLADAQLRQSASVFQHANEGIVITDIDGTILDVNTAFSRITGYHRDEVVGQNPRILKSGHQGLEFYTAMWKTLQKTGRWSGEIWNRRKNGEVFPELLTISAVYNENGKVQRYVALFADITQIKEHQQQLEHIAHYDALTSLPNRMLLADRLQQAMTQAKRHKSQVAVVYLDLDGFKAINDTYGHEVGDRLLVHLAERMKEALRSGDTLSRLGGDEFVAVLLDLDSHEASVPILDRLLQAAAKPVLIDGLKHNVTSSLGVSFFPQASEVDADQLLRQADQAMYQAKLSGKNRYYIFDAEHDQAVRGHHEILERIRQALANNEFVLFYQPKVNMRSGEVIGVEALVRWQHPERGLLPPATFLPAIENHQLSVKLGEWVLKTALGQITTWRKAGIHLPVSVNIDAVQLQQPDFVERLKAELARHPHVQHGELELEILETSALEDIAWVSKVISSCSELGVGFALDDFGTGYSSLTYLKRLPAQLLKIDQSFVRNMLDDPDDLAILDGIIGLTEAFQRKAIAEGVETQTHSEMLLRLGCELGQGYAIARPMPAEEITAWLTTWRKQSVYHENRTISRDNMPVLFAIVEHRAWLASLSRYLRNQQPDPPLMNHHQCRFGQWLDQSGAARQTDHPEMASILSLHEEVHRKAEELLQLKQQGQTDAALNRLGELELLRDDLHELLMQLIDSNVKNGSDNEILA